MDDYSILIIGIIILFAFFHGIETAFTTTGRLRLETEEEDDPQKSIDKLISFFYRHSGRFLSAMMAAKTILLTMAITVAAGAKTISIYSFVTYGNPFVSNIVLTSCLIFIIGMLIPHFIFLIAPVRTLRLFAIFIYVVYRLLNPFTSVLSTLVKGILGLIGIHIKREDSEKAFTRGELDSLINKTVDQEKKGQKVNEEVKIFQNALDFSTIRIRDCMVPRTEIKALDINEVQKEELESMFIETGHSKLIIYDNDIDHIIGYLHSSEMFTHPDTWKEHIREIPIIPETMAAQKLLQLFMVQKKSLAVVVDEFGGTSGIVSLEDLVEEIFGDIEDEHDTNNYTAKQIGPDEYILSARLEIEKINQLFPLNLPESNDYQTLGGLILNLYQNFPKLNEAIKWEDMTFKVVKKATTKIELVKIKVEKPESKKE